MSKTFKKTEPVVLQETMQELGVSAVALSEMLGVSARFVSNCISRGDAPAWVEVACLGLRELARDRDADKPRTFVVQADPAKAAGIVAVLDAMGVSYAEMTGTADAG